MSTPCRVVPIRSMAAWSDMAKPWNDLLSQSRSNTVFLTWEWLYSWAECFLEPDDALFILAVYRDNRLVGISPWCIYSTRTWAGTLREVGFLGASAASDYMDVFALPGQERETALALYRFLFHAESPPWDRITLSGMASESLFLHHFMQAAGEAGKHAAITYDGICPSVRLPISWEAYIETLSSNRRQAFRNDSRRLEKDGKVVFHRASHREAEEAFDNFLKIPHVRSSDVQDRFERFLRTVLGHCHENGWMRIDLLSVSGENVMGLCHLQYNGALSSYTIRTNRHYDKGISLGSVTVGRAIQQAIADGLSVVDFLRGGESYKFHWSNGGRALLTLEMYSRHPAALACFVWQTLKSVGKIIVR